MCVCVCVCVCVLNDKSNPSLFLNVSIHIINPTFSIYIKYWLVEITEWKNGKGKWPIKKRNFINCDIVTDNCYVDGCHKLIVLVGKEKYKNSTRRKYWNFRCLFSLLYLITVAAAICENKREVTWWSGPDFRVFSWFRFLCLMTYQPSWVNWYHRHPRKRTVKLRFKKKTNLVSYPTRAEGLVIWLWYYLSHIWGR